MSKNKFFIIHHLLLIVLLILIFLVPNARQTAEPISFGVAVLVCELICLFDIIRNRDKAWPASAIFSIVLVIFILWEVFASVLGKTHPVLVPAPENVFAVFPADYKEIIKGIFTSLKIIFLGSGIGIILGTVLGFICGWFENLKKVFFPIANVIAPIPAIIYSPYIIALMPSFKVASIVVVGLSVFWPTFLRSILQASAVDKNIVDSAKTLGIDGFTMIFKILIPYSMPQILNVLKVQLTMTFTILMFAEMLGSTEGMGYYIVNNCTYGNYTKVIVGMIVIGTVVTILNKVISRLVDKALTWEYY